MNNTLFSILILFFSIHNISKAQFIKTSHKVPFHDSFEDHKNQWRKFYSKIKKGRYIISTIMPNVGQTSTLNFDINEQLDFNISAFFAITWNRKREFMGITWGGDDEGNAFFFGVNKDKKYIIYKSNNDQKDTLKYSSSNILQGLNNYNLLKVIKSGEKYEFYINTQLVHSIPFEKFYGKEIGFFIGQASEMYIVDFSVRYNNQSDNYATLNQPRRSTVEYLDKNRNITFKPKDANYFRYFELDENGLPDGVMNTFRMDSSLFIQAEYEGGIPSGKYIQYYSNQTKQAIGQYSNGYQSGKWKYWYSSGQVREERLFKSLENQERTPNDYWFKVLNFWEANGKQTVIDGNGFYKGFLKRELLGYVYTFGYNAEGNIKNGNPDGFWKGTYENGNAYFEEDFRDGKLIRGKSFDHQGNQYNYTRISSDATPMNGIEDFYRKLGKKIKYPKSARRKGIEGKVYISFIVAEDGALKNIKVLKGLDPDCDLAALQAMNQMPPWYPGSLRGQKIKSQMSIPIFFSLR